MGIVFSKDEEMRRDELGTDGDIKPALIDVASKSSVDLSRLCLVYCFSFLRCYCSLGEAAAEILLLRKLELRGFWDVLASGPSWISCACFTKSLE